MIHSFLGSVTIKTELGEVEYCPDKRIYIIRDDENWIKGVMHLDALSI